MLAFAFSIMLTATFATAALTAVFTAADLRMGGPPVKARTGRSEHNGSLLARRQVSGSGRTEFLSAGEVHLNANALEGLVRRVLHGTLEGIARRIVGQDQSGAVSNLVVGLVQGIFCA